MRIENYTYVGPNKPPKLSKSEERKDEIPASNDVDLTGLTEALMTAPDTISGVKKAIISWVQDQD